MTDTIRIAPTLLAADSGGAIHSMHMGDSEILNAVVDRIVAAGELYTFTSDATVLTNIASYTISPPGGDGPGELV